MPMINRAELYHDLNAGMTEERFHAFEWNLKKNLPLIARHGGLEKVVPFLRGRNVVIAGAGPSLDEGLRYLRDRELRRRIIVISADMALLPLVKNGVIPDYVMSCETTPVDFFGGMRTAGMHLLAFSCMSSVNLRKWRGAVSFYNWMIFEAPYRTLWETAGTGLGYLATGSIITTQAVSFALGCGIGSLALIGNDLAFGHRFYARDTVPLDNSVRICGRFSGVESMEMDRSRKRRQYEIRRGDAVYFTDSQFLAAKTWLEDLMARNNFPVHDCSVPGCAGSNIVKTGLGEYFSHLEIKKR